MLLADPGRPWALASGHPRVSPALESVHARTEAEQIGRKRRGSATTSTDAPVQPEDAMRVSQGENGRSVKDQQAQLAGTPLRHPARPKGEIECRKRAQHQPFRVQAARHAYPPPRPARCTGLGAGEAGRSVSPPWGGLTVSPGFSGLSTSTNSNAGRRLGRSRPRQREHDSFSRNKSPSLTVMLRSYHVLLERGKEGPECPPCISSPTKVKRA